MAEERIHEENADSESLIRDANEEEGEKARRLKQSEEERKRVIEKLEGVYCLNAGEVGSIRGRAYVECRGVLDCPYRGLFVDLTDFVHDFYICTNKGIYPDKKEDIFGRR